MKGQKPVHNKWFSEIFTVILVRNFGDQPLDGARSNLARNANFGRNSGLNFVLTRNTNFSLII